MRKKIILEYNDKEYELGYTPKIIKKMEDEGFDANEFFAEHKSVFKNQILLIKGAFWFSFRNADDEFVLTFLQELSQEQIVELTTILTEAILDFYLTITGRKKSAEEENSKKVSWTVG